MSLFFITFSIIVSSQAGGAGGQFQRKYPNFLWKNPDYLLENVDFVTKQVERIARVPYLCLGDTLGSRMYELDDAVMVLRARTAGDEAAMCVPTAAPDAGGGSGGGPAP